MESTIEFTRYCWNQLLNLLDKLKQLCLIAMISLIGLLVPHLVIDLHTVLYGGRPDLDTKILIENPFCSKYDACYTRCPKKITVLSF